LGGVTTTLGFFVTALGGPSPPRVFADAYSNQIREFATTFSGFAVGENKNTTFLDLDRGGQRGKTEDQLSTFRTRCWLPTNKGESGRNVQGWNLIGGGGGVFWFGFFPNWGLGDLWSPLAVFRRIVSKKRWV